VLIERIFLFFFDERNRFFQFGVNDSRC